MRKIINKIIKEKNNTKYFQIKPYRYNEYEVNHFLWFLYNFTWIDENIDFLISWNWNNIELIVKIPEKIEKYFQNSFYANFPDSELDILNKKDIQKEFDKKYIKFKTNWFKNIKDFQKNWLYLEPLKDILSIWENLWKDDYLTIWYKLNFKLNLWEKIINFIKNIFSKNKEKKDLYFSTYFYINSNDNWTKNLIKNSIQSTFRKFTIDGKVKISNHFKKYYVNFEEFINFYHILNKDFFIKHFNYLTYKKLPSPTNLPNTENTEKNEITLIWDTDYKNFNIRFWLKEEDLARHCYIVGKTWMWKSTLISNMVRDNLLKNKWVCVIDPHGDLIDTILQHIPSWRINDVILFDVSDFSYPIWFNILQYKNEEEKNILVSGIVATFKKLYKDSWGPRLEYILRNSLLAIIEYPNATLLHLTRMLNDKNFLNEILEYVKDPIVIKFFRQEFLKWQDNFRNEAIAPIVNKVWQFLSSPVVRNIFWQTQTKLNIKKIMDEGKILLVNLSKWKIWEDNASMIGSFFVTKFQIDAMARANTSFENRKPFYLYIDEFQNFTTDSFENILSEARKYKLSLIFANQYINQIQDNVKNAIFGNVWTLISFWIWYEDGQIISKQFKETISANDLLSIPKFKAYIKLMVDGIISDPFSMKTFPLPNPENWPEIKNKVKNQTHQSYSIKKEIIEKKIKIWTENNFSIVDKAVKKAKEWNNNLEKIQNIDELKKWRNYNGIIKLKYNFWVFVSLNWWRIEWLLHKSKMKIPEWLKWKEFYNIWDKVSVKLDLIKEKNWEKTIEFTQK